jgi:hypothetical protein
LLRRLGNKINVDESSSLQCEDRTSNASVGRLAHIGVDAGTPS